MIPVTKIIATLGPSSSKEAILRKMITRGLDCVRLNFSHGTPKEHLEKISLIRALNAKMRRSIKIMQDLEGYRIRVGRLNEPLQLKKSRYIYFTQQDIVGSEREVSFDYLGSLKRIKPGFLIYVDDGRIVLEVKSVGKKHIKLKIITPGLLQSHKGINIPQAKLEFEALTEKDKKDLNIGIGEKLDYIAQSFVNSAEDLRLLKELIKPRHPGCKIIAKIESRDALKNLEEIIDSCDGIIVARGDLGICVPIYKVPVIQKEIVKMCRRKQKPVVVATQMLDSMIEHPSPTRAEVSDVANAILDGATHLLLSAETAIGRHPAKVVDMMNKIIKNTEIYAKETSGLLG